MATETDDRKTVLITGCAAGGIGHSLALSFHKRGFRVFATARSLEQLTTLAEQGIETLVLVVDDDESILRTVKAVEDLTGDRGLDFLGTWWFLISHIRPVPPNSTPIHPFQRRPDSNLSSFTVNNAGTWLDGNTDWTTGAGLVRKDIDHH